MKEYMSRVTSRRPAPGIGGRKDCYAGDPQRVSKMSKSRIVRQEKIEHSDKGGKNRQARLPG